MPDRRAALVDAGVELALQQRFQDLLASVDTRSITGAAGVTTGSFFHHFKNRAEFTEAVIDRFLELGARSTQRTLEVLDSFGEGGELSPRRAAGSEWSGLGEDEMLNGLQHLLVVARHRPLCDETDRTAADVLIEHRRRLDGALVPSYERGLRAIGREMLPPFTVLELSIGLGALANGLEMRRSVDPDAIRDDLFADLVGSLVANLTRPARERSEETRTGGRTPAARATVASREATGGTRDQIAEAAAPLFVDRRVGDVKIAEIAEAAGLSASTVYHQFGRVSAVAAAGWAGHLPELEAIATEPLTSREGPVQRIEQVLVRFIEIARANRGALEGLALESIGATNDEPGPAPTSTSTPLVGLLAAHVRELRARGVLRRRIDSEGLARSILQLIAMRVLSDREEPEERIIDDTLGLLLEGALARTER